MQHVVWESWSLLYRLYLRTPICAPRAFSVDALVILSLKLMSNVVSVAPHIGCAVLLYTDASDAPEQKNRFGLGGVLIDQQPSLRVEYFSTSLTNLSTLGFPKRHTWDNLSCWPPAPVALHT